jgi:tRNA (guanine37-N1)-methyltransferase
VRFDVITLFPELFAPLLSAGVTRRAFESGQVEVRLWNPRDFAEGNYRRVDDRPFGGGPGMVMLAEPLERCLQAIRQDRTVIASDEAIAMTEAKQSTSEGSPRFARDDTSPVIARDEAISMTGCPVVLFSPIGERLNHASVQSWSDSEGAVLLCGRYEGIDQRFIDRHVTHQISLGDFVLSGGEIAAMALLDAVARLQPGVLNDEGSHQFDSFNPAIDGLLDSPHFTRPEVWQGQAVPEALLSGHHERIARHRREQSLATTARWRPDVIEAVRAAGRLSAADEAFLRDLL